MQKKSRLKQFFLKTTARRACAIQQIARLAVNNNQVLLVTFVLRCTQIVLLAFVVLNRLMDTISLVALKYPSYIALTAPCFLRENCLGHFLMRDFCCRFNCLFKQDLILKVYVICKTEYQK